MGNNKSRPNPSEETAHYIYLTLSDYEYLALETLNTLKSDDEDKRKEYKMAVQSIDQLVVRLQHLRATLEKQRQPVDTAGWALNDVLRELEESRQDITSVHNLKTEVIQRAETRIQEQVEACKSRYEWVNGYSPINKLEVLRVSTCNLVSEFQRELDEVVDEVATFQQSFLAAFQHVEYLVNSIQSSDCRLTSCSQAVLNKPVTSGNEDGSYKSLLRDTSVSNQSLSNALLENPKLFRPIHYAFFKEKYNRNFIARHVLDEPFTEVSCDGGPIHSKRVQVHANDFFSTSRQFDNDKGYLGIKLEGLRPYQAVADVFPGIEVNEGKTFCKMCDTFIPSGNADVKLHVSGKRHLLSKSKPAPVLTVQTNNDVKVVESRNAIIPSLLEAGQCNKANEDRIYCNVCDLYLANANCFASHVSGKKHKKKLGAGPNNKIEVMKTEVPVTIVKSSSSLPNRGEKLQADATLPKDVNKSVVKVRESVAASIFCDVCNTNCPGDTNSFKTHVIGTNHQKNLALSSTTNDTIKTSDVKVDVTKKEVLTIVGSSATFGDESFERRSILDSKVVQVQAKDLPSTSKHVDSGTNEVGSHIHVLKPIQVNSSTVADEFPGIEVNEGKTFCRICDTFIPSGNADVKLHVSGKRHLLNKSKPAPVLTVTKKDILTIVGSSVTHKTFYDESLERISILPCKVVQVQAKDLSSTNKHVDSGIYEVGSHVQVLKPIQANSSTVADVFPGIEVNKDKTFCRICDTFLSSGITNIKLHISGKFHKLNNSKLVPVLKLHTNNDVNVDQCKNAVIPTSSVSAILEKTNEDRIHCSVCDIYLSNAICYVEHRNGRKHKNNMALSLGISLNNVDKVDVRRTKSEVPVTIVKSSATLRDDGKKLQADVTLPKEGNKLVVKVKESVSVSDTVSTDNKSRPIFCDVCNTNCPGDPNNVKSHVNRRIHQKKLALYNQVTGAKSKEGKQKI